MQLDVSVTHHEEKIYEKENLDNVSRETNTNVVCLLNECKFISLWRLRGYDFFVFVLVIDGAGHMALRARLHPLLRLLRPPSFPIPIPSTAAPQKASVLMRRLSYLTEIALYFPVRSVGTE